jgi:hypothetical protein
MLLDRITCRASFCARKFISLVDFEYENIPNEREASASRARSSPAVVR